MGAEPEPAEWQYYVRAGNTDDMRPDNPRYEQLIRLWKRLPSGHAGLGRDCAWDTLRATGFWTPKVTHHVAVVAAGRGNQNRHQPTLGVDKDVRLSTGDAFDHVEIIEAMLAPPPFSANLPRLSVKVGISYGVG